MEAYRRDCENKPPTQHQGAITKRVNPCGNPRITSGSSNWEPAVANLNVAAPLRSFRVNLRLSVHCSDLTSESPPSERVRSRRVPGAGIQTPCQGSLESLALLSQGSRFVCPSLLQLAL